MNLKEALKKGILFESPEGSGKYVFGDAIKEITEDIVFTEANIKEINFNNIERIMGVLDLSFNQITNINFMKIKYIYGDIWLNNNQLHDLIINSEIQFHGEYFSIGENYLLNLDLSKFKFVKLNSRATLDASKSTVVTIILPLNISLYRLNISDCCKLKKIFFNGLKIRYLVITKNMMHLKVMCFGGCVVEGAMRIYDFDVSLNSRALFNRIEGPFNL